MKINSVDKEEVNKLEENIAKQKNITVDTISKSEFYYWEKI